MSQLSPRSKHRTLIKEYIPRLKKLGWPTQRNDTCPNCQHGPIFVRDSGWKLCCVPIGAQTNQYSCGCRLIRKLHTEIKIDCLCEWTMETYHINQC